MVCKIGQTSVNSPLASIPNNILGLNFDEPGRGISLKRTRLRPIIDTGLEEGCITVISKNAAMGGAVGSAGGAVSSILSSQLPESFQLFKKITDWIKAGCLLGGIAGAVRGIYLTHEFFIARPPIFSVINQSSDKAQKILKAFIESQLDMAEQENKEITCQISFQVMVFPVTVNCGSQVPHTFDYVSILDWLSTKSTCPTCRKHIKVDDLKIDYDKDKQVHKVVANIFNTMEAILNQLPKRFFGLDSMPTLSAVGHIKALAEKIKKGEEFLAGDVSELAKKISDPKTLSDDEKICLSYFLIHQFNPLKSKIDRVYELTSQYLTSLYTKKQIDRSAYRTQQEQLQNWYENFDIIPKECKIMRKLSSL